MKMGRYGFLGWLGAVLLLAGSAMAAPSESVRIGRELDAIDWSRAKVIRFELDEMTFHPDRVVFKAGQPYRLRIENAGEKRHNLMSPAFFAAILQHSLKGGGLLVQNPKDAKIDLLSGQVAEFHFLAKTKGHYPIYCSVDDHRARGMEGEFIIE
ncbi:MAG: hypothetical protein HZC25_13245 [Rhodospirillales bacterium]|nr:hypothetical protein [Rhodospirillales bacterium]